MDEHCVCGAQFSICQVKGGKSMPIKSDETKVRESFKEKSIEETLSFKYSITSYGADYPVDGLVRRIKDGAYTFRLFSEALCGL